MKRPHFRLDRLCFLVLMLALNLAWYRETVRSGYASPSVFGFPDRGFDASVLPMLTVLGMGLYLVVVRRGRPPAFLVGFEAGGLTVTLTFMVWMWVAPHSFIETIMDKPFPWFGQAVQQNRISIDEFLLAIVIIQGSPQLLAALTGGWLARRIADRRAASSSASSQ
jgi:hypothetical protein